MVSLAHSDGVLLVLQCRLYSEAIQTLAKWSEEPGLDGQQRERIGELLGKNGDALRKSAKKLGYRPETHPGLETDLFQGVVRGVTDAWGRVCEQMNQL